MWTIVFLLLAAFGTMHQHLLLYYIFGIDTWVEWGQMFHHEALIAMCLSIAAWEVIRPWLNRIIHYLAERYVHNKDKETSQ